MKGILFIPSKHKAIREHPDIVTVTRRVINPQPPQGEDIEVFGWFAPEIKEGKAPEGLWMEDKDGLKFLQKPRYQVGEIVYIKEAWFIGSLCQGLIDPKMAGAGVPLGMILLAKTISGMK